MRLKLTILLILTTSSLIAQTTIRGRVISSQNEGLSFANVILLNTYDGGTSDENGNFTFTTSETGSHILIAKMIGFKDAQLSVSLSGKPIALTIELQEQISELNAVTISAGSFTASDESRRTVFRAVDIATTAGATADIAGALNTLPGTQKVGESGRLFVRGGDGNEAKTFIDGLLVLDAYSPSAPNT